MAISKRVVMHFPRALVDQPIMCRLAREFNIDFNILKASVTPNEEGVLVVELKGAKSDYDRGILFLAETGVKAQPLSRDIVRNEASCTHCGACITLCPAGALAIDGDTRAVRFENEKCIACAICVPACPVRAMEIRF